MKITENSKHKECNDCLKTNQHMSGLLFNKHCIKIKDIFRKINYFLPGLQSVSKEQIDRRTLEMVSAGDQLSFKMSKQITP